MSFALPSFRASSLPSLPSVPASAAVGSAWEGTRAQASIRLRSVSRESATHVLSGVLLGLTAAWWGLLSMVAPSLMSAFLSAPIVCTSLLAGLFGVQLVLAIVSVVVLCRLATRAVELGWAHLVESGRLGR